MARAPQEILVVKAKLRVVPTTVARMPVDHPVGSLELIRGVSKSTDHYDFCPRRPSEPSQPAAEPDEELRVPQPAHPLAQGTVTCLIFHPVRQMVVAMSAWVTIGSIAPGVQDGSGRGSPSSDR